MSQSTTHTSNTQQAKRSAAYLGLALIIGAALWVASHTHSPMGTPRAITCFGPPSEPQARIVLPSEDPRF